MTPQSSAPRVLVDLLSAESEMLEQLLDRIQQMARLADDVDTASMLGLATKEAGVIIDQLAELELALAVVASEIGRLWDCPGDPPRLAELVECAPVELRTDLEGHLSTLRSLECSVRDAAEEGSVIAARTLLRTGWPEPEEA